MAAARLPLLAIVGGLLAACGSGSPDGPPPPVDADRSTLTAAPASAIADGVATVTLTATARDAGGAPLGGRTAVFTVGGTDDVLSAASATTDADGVATTTVASTRAEAKAASVVIDGVAVAQQATATFVAGPAASLALTGVPSQVTAGTGATVTVTAWDAFGNLAEGYRGTVRFTSTDAQAVLPADVTFGEGDAGQRTVDVEWRTSGTQGLAATDVSAAPLSTSAETAVTPAAAARLTFRSQPAESVVAGEVLAPALRVAVLDAFDNLVPEGTTTVALALLDGPEGAVLSGGGAAGTVDGVADFAALWVDKAGTDCRLLAMADGLTGAVTQPFAVVAAAPDASASAVAAAPAVLAAGETATLTVTVRDVFGNPVPGVTVSFAASGAGNVLTQPAPSGADGVATGLLTSTSPGEKIVSASAAGVALAQQPTASFAAGPAASLALTGVPSQVTAGAGATVTLTAWDAFGNVADGYRGTVHFTSTDARAVLPADVTFGAGDAGQRTVGVEWRTSGIQGLTATDAAAPALVASVSTSVAAASPVELAFAGQPSASVAGAFLSPAVRVALLDAFGNVATAGTTSVSLALLGGAPGAVLTGGGATATVNGEAEFPALWVDKAAAGYQLVASAGDLAPATSVAFAIDAAAPDATASTVSVGYPWVVAGESTALTASLVDFFGNPVPGVAVTFAATGTDNTVTQPSAASDAAGVATGSLLSTKAEAKTVSAMAGAIALAAQPVVNFYAYMPSADESTVVADPTTVVADGTTRATITVTLRDAWGNPTPGRMVGISSSRGALDLLSSWSYGGVHYESVDEAGVVTFTVASAAAGTSTYSVMHDADWGNPLPQTAQVTFLAGPVSATVSSTVPTPPTVPADGLTASSVVVTLRDAKSNPIAGKVVTLASSRGALDAITPASGTSDGAGEVRFTVTSPTLGVAALSATDETDGVTLAPAQLAFTGPVDAAQSTVTATPWVRADGVAPALVTVRLRDAIGSPVSGKVVSLASSRGALDTISAASGPSDGDGAVTFEVRSSTFGASTFSATDETDALALLATAEVDFRSYLVFAVEPAAEVPSGAPLDPAPVVTARDAAGNTDGAFAAGVTLALGANPVGGALSGTVATTALAGVATFPDLLLDKAGAGYTLVATSAGSGKDPVTSSAFTVVAGTPDHLVFLVQPSDSGAGPEALFQLAIHDAAGNPTSVTGLPVTVALDANPGGATLEGTLTAASFDGLVTFAGLGVSAPGQGYTLVATGDADGLVPAVSQPFDVTVPTVVGLGTPASCSEAALAAALAAGGRITFDCGPDPVTITLTGQKTVAVSAGLDGGGLVTLSGGGTTRLFDVRAGATLALARLGIRDGRTGGNGAGIYNGGTLSLVEVTLSGNATSASEDYWGSPANGGAVFNAGGTVLVERSTFASNTVYCYHCCRGTGANGGAIFTGGGTVLVANSTFAGNTATAFETHYGTGGNGGAIFNGGSRLWIVGSTFSANAVFSAGNYYGTGGQGGAIFGGATLANTLLARGASGTNCAGIFTNSGHDLDSDGSCGVGPATDPRLDPAGLADHGGPTWTVALQAGSPAIDAGDGDRCAAPPLLGVDQRGFARPGAGATTCSIGAFEAGSSGPP